MLHSRERLLPIYPLEMHTAVVEALARLGVNVCLGERVMQWPGSNDGPGEKVVVTDKGTRFTADIVLACTGQKPHVALAREMCGLAPTGRLHVRPTMQVVGKDESNLDHMFAVGDCAETGAIQAGHTAWYQAEVAARNVQRLIDGVVVAELESYKVTPPAIKVTLGLTHYVKAAGGVVETGDDGKEDLDARLVWGGSCHAQDLGDDE